MMIPPFRSLILRAAATLIAVAALVPAVAQAPVEPPAGPLILTPPPDDPPVTPPPVVAPPPPEIVVVLADDTAASWLSGAGFSVVKVNEPDLPGALSAAAVAVVPLHEIRQTATVDALKAFTSAGGKVFGTYWGPVGLRTPVTAALSDLFSLRVTGWSGKAGNLVAANGQGRSLFNHTGRLRLTRGYSVVATPVVPPPPPAPPAPVVVAAPKPAVTAPPKPAARSNGKPAPKPPVKPAPPAPPPPAVYTAGRWITEAGKPLRSADAAVIAGPSTLWVGENIFAPGNGTPEVRRWFASAVLFLAPTLRTGARSSVVTAAESRVSATRTLVNDAISRGLPAALPDAQIRLDAAQKALSAAVTESDYQALLKGLENVDSALLDAAAHTMPSRPVEVRAVWIEQTALTKSRDDIRRLVQRLADAKFNVLLPEVVYRGRAAYPSAVYPQDTRLAGFDPLRALIEEAKRRGLEVHPWVWTLAVGYYGEQGPLLRKSPEWAARDRAGRIISDGDRLMWLSPSVPQARAAVRNVVREIASKYEVDGIHLDYMRYESPWWDYSDPARAAYQAQKSVDPSTLSSISPAWADWHLWREEQVNSLVREIRGDLRSIKSGLELSAAVYQTPDDARRERLQDWGYWSSARWMDWVAPMTYTTDASELDRWLSEDAVATDGKTLLVPGLANFVVRDPLALMNQLALARARGASGVSFFAASQLSDDLLRALKLGPFRATASVPWRDPAQAVRALAKAAAETLRTTSTPDPTQAGAARNAAQAVDAYAGGSDLAWLAANAPLHELKDPPLNDPRYDEARSLLEAARRTATAFLPPAAALPSPTSPPVSSVTSPVALPAARIPVGTGVVNVDGRLDEPAWASAVTLNLERTVMGEKAPVPTTVRAMRDAATLYLGFVCTEPGMPNLKAGIAGRDNPVYQDDSVEVFVNSNGRGLPYRHFIVGAGTGTWDDLSGDNRWNTKWSSAVTRDVTSWTVEIAIPFASLGGVPGPDTVWKVNLARNRQADGSTAIAWAVPYGPYATIDRFGNWSF